MINIDTKITAKLDWLSITVAEIKYPENWDKKRKEMSRGMSGYDIGVRYLDGRIELCSSNRKDMQPHVIFSGSCIDKLALQGNGNTMEILRAMADGSPSRLDIAVDIKNGCLNIEELRDEFHDGKAVTSAKKGVYMQTVGEIGETLYIGSARSQRRIRIYDKAAEQGNTDIAWTRIELQLRDDAARGSFELFVKSEVPLNLIPKLIIDFVDFPEIGEWVQALGVSKMRPSPPEKKETNRLDWLMNTAAKSLANEMIQSGEGFTILDAFTKRAAAIFIEKQSKYIEF